MKKKPYKKYSLIRLTEEDYQNFIRDGHVKEYMKTYNGYTICGLKYIPYGDGSYDYQGACALLKDPNHEGYCSLCAVYRKDGESNVFGNNGTTVQFEPLYNKDGQRILIKYNRDEIFAMIDMVPGLPKCGIPRGDCRLTTLKYGSVDMWSEKEK